MSNGDERVITGGCLCACADVCVYINCVIMMRGGRAGGHDDKQDELLKRTRGLILQSTKFFSKIHLKLR